MQLVVNRGKHQWTFIPVTDKVFTIGRHESCQLRPRSDEVSRLHAELKLISGLVIIRDLGSRNGTLVNGQPLTSQLCLRHGDRIEIGPLSFTFLMEETREVKRTGRSEEDEVAAWLIGDAEDESHSADLEVPDGDTAESEVVPGKSGRLKNPPPTTQSPADSSDEAYNLLKSMGAGGPEPD